MSAKEAARRFWQNRLLIDAIRKAERVRELDDPSEYQFWTEVIRKLKAELEK